MLKTIGSRLQSRGHFPRFLALLAIAAVLLLLTVGAGLATSDSATKPGNPAVLHVQGQSTGAGTDGSVEAWIDLTNNEGKIVETAPDGTLRRVEVVVGDSHTTYLADHRHMIIRRGFDATSPQAASIRNRLLGARDAVERGGAQRIGTGQVAGRPTERAQFSIDGTPIVVDVDQATGLMLRTEAPLPGGSAEVTETTYNVIEYIDRSTLPQTLFQVDLPPDIGREEYTEGDPQSVSAELPYAVYAAPSSEGGPIAAYRYFSTSAQSPTENAKSSTDRFYLIYQGPEGEFGVISSLPPSQSGTGKSITGHTEKRQLAGKVWEVEDHPSLFLASTELNGSYVTVYAPNQTVFERIAGSLQRVNR